MTDSLIQVLLCGLGGQGIVLAGTILGQAAVNDGKWVAGANAYGSQARGGIARSEVIIATEPIIFPRVIQPDILVAFSQSTYENDLTRLKKESAWVLYDNQLIEVAQIKSLKQIAIPATDTSIKIAGHKQAVNMVMLGALIGCSRLTGKESLIQAVEQHSSPEFREQNRSAVLAGFEIGAEDGL